MSQLASPGRLNRRARFMRYCRGCVAFLVLAVCLAVAVNAVALAPFEVPTGSMAPQLLGQHRICTCDRCGAAFPVGRHAEDRHGTGEARLYRKVYCPQCGQFPVPLSAVIESPGDRVVVNRLTYRLRSPARWEVAVFRLFGSYFVKRILGLPGEEIEIRAGDIFINGKRCRKNLGEALAMRVLLYDQLPASSSIVFTARWERDDDAELFDIDGRERSAMLTYRNFDLGTQKCEPIRDEYSYNAGGHADGACVHDFLVTCNLNVSAGDGDVVLKLCDGGDWAGVRIPVGADRPVSSFSCRIASDSGETLVRSDIKRSLTPGRHAIQFAFVDRRLTLAVDGVTWSQTDLPDPGERVGVERPFRLEAQGVRVTLSNFQLFRDVHYGQQGRNGVHGKAVRLGTGQYFVLGDNSPRSQDSRFWGDAGQVPVANLIGPVQRRMSGMK